MSLLASHALFALAAHGPGLDTSPVPLFHLVGCLETDHLNSGDMHTSSFFDGRHLGQTGCSR